MMPFWLMWRRACMYNAGHNLNTYSWQDISAIAAEGRGRELFSIGDCKEIHIQGKVGTLTVDDIYYVYIIGFDHNGATNTIDFGTFKTLDGVDVCLTDSYYSTTATTGVSGAFTMNTYATNSAGWGSCQMRSKVLGSASSPLSPTANTLLAAMPEDLRAVMKAMSIYSNNSSGNSNAAGATTDYLPLLSGFEITGSSGGLTPAEVSRQKQYEYYRLNSSIKYKASDPTSAATWRTRSVTYSNSGGFQAISASGGLNGSGYANRSWGVAPIFRV